MSSGREYVVGSTFQGIVKCVKSYGAFIDIGDDVGLLHISEINHVHVTSMETLLFLGKKSRWAFYKFKVQVIVIMIIFIHEVRKVSNKLIMIEINVQVMILNQDKTKGHLKLSTKQLEAKPGDMLHVQAYQKVCFCTFCNVI